MKSNLINNLKILDVPDVTTSGDTPKDVRPDWGAIFSSATVTGTELDGLAIPPREFIIGEWLRTGDLGYIFAPRGVGKTWLSMYMAQAVAAGGQVGPWAVLKPRRVLYVDGEMALDLTQRRYRALTQKANENLVFLHHEVVFQRTGAVLNLALPIVQEALLQHILEMKIEVLILDNLSCLFSGVKENDADAWEMILPWLLDLRRRGIAVIIVAHAGRNGQMRGTSRREDAAVWVMSLSEPAEHKSESQGARFLACFTKCRNSTSAEAPDLEWHFEPQGADGVKVNFTIADPLLVLRGWIERGLDSCSDLAAEMDISKGTVSKLAARGMKEGWLKIVKGRRYQLVSPSDTRKPYAD